MLDCWTGRIALLTMLVPLAASATGRCERVLARLGSSIADATCFESTDLTTANPATTPANNSLPGLPSGAFTPVTDRSVIAPSAGKKTPITRVVPGLQINARFADDPTGQGRFLLRLPDDWNGRLVVAGASGTRSEFNGDFAWSDYVVQLGYAYASQNKGVLNLRITSLSSATPPNGLACRLNPSSTVWVNFYDNDDGQPFTRWAEYMAKAAELARVGVKAGYGRPPRYTYAVGTSNGGYQVRRAVESAPRPLRRWRRLGGNLRRRGGAEHSHRSSGGCPELPGLPGLRALPELTAARNIVAAGYPPDLVLSPTSSLWTNYSNQFWEVTLCQWQKRLDSDLRHLRRRPRELQLLGAAVRLGRRRTARERSRRRVASVVR